MILVNHWSKQTTPKTVYSTHEVKALDDYSFKKIVNHTETDGKIVFTVQFWSLDQEDHVTLEVPFMQQKLYVGLYLRWFQVSLWI